MALMISMLLVPLLIRYARAMKLVDAPGPRKVHAASVPRTGGIAIVIGSLVPLLVFRPHDPLLFGILIGCLVIFVFGVIDDRNNLNYKWKFFGQFVAVFAAMQGGLLINYLPFFGIDPVAPWLSYPLTALFLLGVTNAINLSDGLDGLAAGTSLITLGMLAWLFYETGSGGYMLALVALAVMGAICGFLRYNNHPAVVFMGDAGSQFLGFITGCLAILLTQEVNAALNPALLLLLLGLPILDTLAVMVWRIRRGHSPFEPDRNHFHHRLLEFGFRHYEAVSVIYIVQATLVTAALLFRYQSDLEVVGFYLVFSTVVLGFFRWARQSKWRLRIDGNSARERRTGWLRRIDWLPDASAYATEAALAAFLILAALAPATVGPELGLIAIALLAAAALAILLPAPLRRSALRIFVYLAGAFAVYALVLPGTRIGETWVNGLVMLIAALLVIAIRVTRRKEFHTTPMDLLILFFLVIVIIVGSVSRDAAVEYGPMAIRLAVLFYGGEFLFSKGPPAYRLLPAASAVCVLLLAARGLV